MKPFSVIINTIGRLRLSVTLSILVIIALIIINLQLADMYEKMDGKTRSFFGVYEFLFFGYKYCLLIPALLAFILGLTDWRKGGGKWAIISTMLALLACVLVFVELWMLFVHK